MSRSTVVMNALALSLAAGTAFGQSFNVDLNVAGGNGAGVPANSFRGAAGLTGTWNDINSGSPTTKQIFGLNGALTSVTFTRATSGTYAGTFDASLTGDVGKLMMDGDSLAGWGTLQYTFSNLAAGSYAVYTYAGHPNSTNEAGVTVTGTTSDYQYVGKNPISNDLVPGDTHAIHIIDVGAGGSITIKVSDSPLGLAICNGIQIRKLGITERVRFYVDASNAGTEYGSSWSSAYQDLQIALRAADMIGGEDVEVWVGNGFYYPTSGTSRTATFKIASGMHLYGGFFGTEETLADRFADPWIAITALSGSIGSSAQSDNSYHVVDASQAVSSTIIDGFSIVRGQASGGGDDSEGGGMLAINCSATIRNVKFLYNHAGVEGGAVQSTGGSPRFVRCFFLQNSSDGPGGAIYHHTAGTPQVWNSWFLGNESVGRGGAINVNFSDFNIYGSFFSGNTSSFDDGGAVNSGGDETDELILINNTFTLNQSFNGTGGALYINGGTDCLYDNNILWGNTAAFANDLDDQQRATNGGGALYSGGNNTIQGISSNPLIIDADGNDNVAGTTDDNPALDVNSPSIDAGNLDKLPLDGPDMDRDGVTFEYLPLDLDGYARRRDEPSAPDVGIGSAPMVDRGCFEFQPCGPDFNQDGFLNGDDFDAFVEAFELGNQSADYLGDGFVNGDDFDAYVADFESGC